MKKGLALLSGIGVGTGLMYLLDPDRGRRRRALMRDKLVSVTKKIGDLGGKMSRDLRNRVQGLTAEAATALTEGNILDIVLVDRVRAAVGRLPGDFKDIQVSAHNGVVTLSGHAWANELPGLLAEIRNVSGVRDIVSELKVEREADNLLPHEARVRSAGQS